MARPRLIILVRHGQSEGNKNREIHQSIPDHRVKLTNDGWSQAHEAGRRLRNLLRPDDTLHFFTSPYRRTRETTEGILATLTADDPEPTPFRRTNIKVYEEPRLREQDFGNFQPCGAEMERMWQERADYGHFFYRIPNGESAADAYDRVSGFNESMWRQFGEDDFASVCVLVTHGLMARVFLMKWYHFTVEYFEDLRNVDHCEFLIMRKQDNGKYLLENNLRTWSELRRERAQAAIKDGKDKESKDKDGKDKDDKETGKLERTKSVTRRWGGCPNGCNHSSHYKKRHDLEALRQRDVERSASTIAARRQRQQHAISSDEDEHSDPQVPPVVAVTRALDEVIDSPNDIRSLPTVDSRSRGLKSAHLHLGRDFGGTYSGHASLAGSDTDASEDEAHRRHKGRVASLNSSDLVRTTSADSDDGSGSGSGLESSVDGRRGHGLGHGHALANRLGDAPAFAGNGSDEALDLGLDKAEREDRSIRGSVY